MPRARRVKDTDDDNISLLDYPGPDEWNAPPESLLECMVLIFGVKGIGKSTILADFPDSLTLMFEPKRRGLSIRQLLLQKHSAKDIRDGAPDIYKQVKMTTQRWVDDESVQRLNFDTIDIFYEACAHSICASHNIDTPSDAGKSSSDIWNEIRDEFASYFDALKETPLGINLCSHVKTREVETLEGGKMGFAAPSCTPACLKYLQQSVDICLFYGWYNGYRAMMVRDETNASFVAPGVKGKFYQPDGKKLNIFQIPDTDEDETASPYQAISDAFDNKLWDMDTPDDQRTVEKKKPMKKKGPPRK